MSVRPAVLLTVLAALGVSACASTPPPPSPVHAPPDTHAFVKRPAKPKGCDFAVFEAREPPRPYTVLGTVPLSTNEWLGAKGRKKLLGDTACRSGADAVLLPQPSERQVGQQYVREYTAVFVAYTDVPAPVSPAKALPPHGEPPGEDVILVPIGEEVLGDTEGTMTRPVGPEDDAYWKD